ncbi:ComEC/Rec2 family competence protein [Clostridium polynesiense]|uniref:ComEC/Rec2 family competence protein n=1 Tax=Clostridium polynesiense TaxID=1325933 RepID=UPI00058D1825|nr:ComEC/Rec2 family competence protein [Clostridium polynesiense]
MKALNKFLLPILFISMVFFVSCGSNILKKQNSQQLKVYFIDVGQGDSILIQYKGRNMLIDAGPSYKEQKLISFLKSHRIRKLHYVIATHPHEDHIGGMAEVIKNFKIDKFYAPKITTETKAFINMIAELNKKGLRINIAKAGKNIPFHEDIQTDLLSPLADKYQELNNYSAVLMVKYKDISFLFTGDAESIVENQLIKNYENIKADVLKIAHHGSTTSTSIDFLKKVNPKYAVISCGLGNDFGHPSMQVLNNLKLQGIKYNRTDLKGTILIKTDGYKLSS